MSLLLDALQRASKDKAAAQAAQVQSGSETLHLADAPPPEQDYPALTEPVPAQPLTMVAEQPHVSPPLEPLTPAEPIAPSQEASLPEPPLVLSLELPAPPPATAREAPSTAAAAAPSLFTETAGPTATDTAASSSPRVAHDMRRAYGGEAAAATAANPVRKRLWWWLGGGAAVLAVAVGVLVWQLLPLISPSSLLASQPAPPAMPGMEPVEAPVPPATPQAPERTKTETAQPTAPSKAQGTALALANTTNTATNTVTVAPTKPSSPASTPAAVAAGAAASTSTPHTATAVPAPAAASSGASTLVEPVKSVTGSIVSRVRGPSTLEQAYAALLDGRWADAQRAYQQALASNPQERDALLGLAYLAQRQGQTAEARAYYQHTLRLDPDNATARAGLLALGGDAEAPVSASKARDLAQRNPDSAATLATVGAVLVREGLLGEAQQAFARAQQLEPTNVQYAYNHAVALDKLGQREAAMQHYERVLALLKAGHAAAGVQADAVLQRLGQLRQAGVPPAGAAP